MPQISPEDAASVCAQIWEALTDGGLVVVTSHERLDGDGVGSALALCHALRGRGVEVRAFFQPPTPPMFDFLPGMDCCCRDARLLPDSYTLAVLDCGALSRVGDQADLLAAGSTRTINIDHHGSNDLFGDITYVDAQASSSGEMIYGLLKGAGVPLTAEIAECLYAAIVTDTGQFAHQGTTPAALRICAECMAAGVAPHTLVARLFRSPTAEQVKLRSLAVGTLEFHDHGRLATMLITGEMFARTGLGLIDTEGFAEVPIGIQGVTASALLKQMPGSDYIKVSMRSRDPVDVCAVARKFGGGGHVHAAGCEIEDTLENAREAIVKQLETQLDPDDRP